MHPGDRIRAIRLGEGISLAELARRTRLSWSTIYRIEQGKTRNPGLDTVRRIASVLAVSVGVIAGERWWQIPFLKEEELDQSQSILTLAKPAPGDPYAWPDL